MYHSISNKEEDIKSIYYASTTTPEIFRKQIQFLKSTGYNPISIHDAFNGLYRKIILPPKPVVITFDDGFKDFLSEAFPVLHKYKFPAVMFIITKYINNDSLRFKEKECLRWKEIYKLSNEGITIGSHTITHPKLKILNDNEIEYEIKKSKEVIQDKIGKTVDFFSYPYAFPEEDKEFTNKLRILLETNGYKGGVTTIIGRASNKDDKYFLKRIPVNKYDDLTFFKAKLDGAYDWMHKAQYIFKKLKSI